MWRTPAVRAPRAKAAAYSTSTFQTSSLATFRGWPTPIVQNAAV